MAFALEDGSAPKLQDLKYYERPNQFKGF